MLVSELLATRDVICWLGMIPVSVQVCWSQESYTTIFSGISVHTYLLTMGGGIPIHHGHGSSTNLELILKILLQYRYVIVTMAKHNTIEKDGYSGSFQNLNCLSTIEYDGFKKL